MANKQQFPTLTIDYAHAHELAERQREQQITRETELAWHQYEATKQKQESTR